MIRVIDLKLSKTGFVVAGGDFVKIIQWHYGNRQTLTVKQLSRKRYIVQND